MAEPLTSTAPKEKSVYEKTLEARIAEVSTVVAKAVDRHKAKAQGRLDALKAALTEEGKR